MSTQYQPLSTISVYKADPPRRVDLIFVDPTKRSAKFWRVSEINLSTAIHGHNSMFRTQYVWGKLGTDGELQEGGLHIDWTRVESKLKKGYTERCFQIKAGGETYNLSRVSSDDIRLLMAFYTTLCGRENEGLLNFQNSDWEFRRDLSSVVCTALERGLVSREELFRPY